MSLVVIFMRITSSIIKWFSWIITRVVFFTPFWRRWSLSFRRTSNSLSVINENNFIVPCLREIFIVMRKVFHLVMINLWCNRFGTIIELELGLGLNNLLTRCNPLSIFNWVIRLSVIVIGRYWAMHLHELSFSFFDT